jgi:hypothetical protein
VIVPTDVPFKRRVPVEENPAEVIESINVLVIPDTPLVIFELELPVIENDIWGTDGVQ